MNKYTIEGFWKPRLNAVTRDVSAPLIRGWFVRDTGLSTFREAPLTVSTELGGDDDPVSSPILLVSAPGAVGKSTLAKQIAYETGSVYIDLAKAEPVGANTLSGGLVRSEVYQKWTDESMAVLIDGLDEARLKVTQEAFEAFLSDLAELATNRTTPTVLFGRTGAVQDACLLLMENEVEVAVLEIGYFGPQQSVEFADAMVKASKRNDPHALVRRKALELLLGRLREQTETDGDRFAGYAPVLLAVAERVEKESNPHRLIEDIRRGAEPVDLQSVVEAILNREKGKLDELQFEDASLRDVMYSPNEQLDRLAARVYGLSEPELPQMSPPDAEKYANALKSWVSEHPFYGTTGEASSVVFEARICARALLNDVYAEAALQGELQRGAKANPFLYMFYIEESGVSEMPFIQAEHIGVIYASCRASLSLGDVASLLVEGAIWGEEDVDDEEFLRAEVEITLDRGDIQRSRVLRFSTEQVGRVCLGTHVEDVDIMVPHTTVEIGSGTEAILMPPISIHCEKLSIASEKLVVESYPGRRDAAISLETQEYDIHQSRMHSIPILRGVVTLSVSWPNARQFPWTSFAAQPSYPDDPRTAEALRRFRRFVIVFRAHGRGGLARFKEKIEHARMTKGVGRMVLDLMVRSEILSLNGPMYFLDADRLYELTSATYNGCMGSEFSPRAVEFVQRALTSNDS